MSFGSIGGAELVFIILIALIVLGPRRLPEVGRMLGRVAAGLRRGVTEFRSGIESEVDLSSVHEARKAIQQARREIRNLAGTPARIIERELRDAERELKSAGGTEDGPANEPGGRETPAGTIEEPGAEPADAPETGRAVARGDETVR